MLVHSECGGMLEVDTGYHAQQLHKPDKTTELLRGVKCSTCGARLGMLANIESIPAKHEGSQLAAESAYKKQQGNRTN